MKIVNINESQFKKLIEGSGDSTFLDGDNTTREFSSEVSNQAVVTDANGEREMSDPVSTDKFAKQQSPQQWGAVGGRNSSNTI